MKKIKTLNLGKIKIAKLADSSMKNVYGGTQGNNGCGTYTTPLVPCPKPKDTKKPNCP